MSAFVSNLWLPHQAKIETEQEEDEMHDGAPDRHDHGCSYVNLLSPDCFYKVASFSLRETKFVGIPADLKQNRSPFDAFQFYGIGRIHGDTSVLTMSFHDIEGKRLYAVDLEPET